MVRPLLQESGVEPRGDAYARLRSMLLGGEVQPGQRLSHRALAKHLGLSRSPVREALLALEAEGIIQHRPQSGVYLREVGPRELEELYDMRELIEPYAAARAARMANTAQLAHLRDVCDEFAKLANNRNLVSWLDAPENRRRLSMLDREFHATIFAAADNHVVRRFFEVAQMLSLVVSWNFLNVDSDTLAARAVPTAKQHRDIYEAIRKRDSAKASKRMAAHVSGMKKHVLEAIHRPRSGLQLSPPFRQR